MAPREKSGVEIHRLQVHLPQSLWMRLRLIAAQEDRTVTSLLIEGAERLLEQKEVKQKSKK